MKHNIIFDLIECLNVLYILDILIFLVIILLRFDLIKFNKVILYGTVRYYTIFKNSYDIIQII